MDLVPIADQVDSDINLCETDCDQRCMTQLPYCLNRHLSFNLNKNSIKFENFHRIEQIESLQLEYENAIRNLQDSFDGCKQNINTKCKYLKDEIDIRIESLKNQLDEIGQKLLNQIDEIEEKFSKKHVDQIRIEKYKDELDELKFDIKFERFNNEKFKLYKSNLNNINDISNELQTYDQMPFIISDSNIDTNIICKHNCNFENINLLKYMSNKLRIGNYESINLDFCPISFHILSNDLVLFTEFNTIRLYNNRFELIRTVNKINNKTIKPRYVTSNENTLIYICELDFDANNQDILVTDFDFRLVKMYNDPNMHGITGILYANSRVYVSDGHNCTIHCFNENMQIITRYNMNHRFIGDMHLVGDRLCVRMCDIHVYDFDKNSFKFKYKILNDNGRVCVLNSKLLTLYCNRVRCYGDDGDEIIQDINLPRLERFQPNGIECMKLFNDVLLLFAEGVKQIITVKMD